MASDGTLLYAGRPISPIRVLLADDEPGLRTALTELLSHEDRVELIGTAADAEEAIRIAESGHPDVALVDVRMPEGGGPHAAEVMSGVVSELATQLRREEIEREADEALRGDIERFVSGHGVWMVFHPIMELATRRRIGMEALARFGSIPPRTPDQWFAEATALELGLQLELRTLKEALDALPK